MKQRPFDPERLDVEPFAQQAGELAGQWPLAGFERLVDATHAEARPTPDDAVQWRLRGEARAVKGSGPQIWLHLEADTALALVCQRCLGPIATAVHAARSFLFAPDESMAAALDAEVDDDVLALTRALDARELVEDELLLALPLVPRHDRCPDPLPVPADEPVGDEERPNPFAALAALKRSKS